MTKLPDLTVPVLTFLIFFLAPGSGSVCVWLWILNSSVFSQTDPEFFHNYTKQISGSGSATLVWWMLINEGPPTSEDHRRGGRFFFPNVWWYTAEQFKKVAPLSRIVQRYTIKHWGKKTGRPEGAAVSLLVRGPSLINIHHTSVADPVPVHLSFIRIRFRSL
jgi:hypothetical protein